MLVRVRGIDVVKGCVKVLVGVPGGGERITKGYASTNGRVG